MPYSKYKVMKFHLSFITILLLPLLCFDAKHRVTNNKLGAMAYFMFMGELGSNIAWKCCGHFNFVVFLGKILLHFNFTVYAKLRNYESKEKMNKKTFFCEAVKPSVFSFRFSFLPKKHILYIIFFILISRFFLTCPWIREIFMP